MLEWLAVWGVGKASWSVFRPILEDLAKDVAKDAAKSYVGKCFKNVFSVIHRDPLTKATGLALKELLELIESELIRADIDDEDLRDWIDDVRRFTERDNVRQAIAALFLQPDYRLDPKTFATAWQQLEGAHDLPDTFSWPFVAKRFAGKIAEIRQSSKDLQETFASLSKVRDSAALQEIAGLPPDFDLETYREALFERHRNLDFGSLDTSGAYYSGVRLLSVFVPQSVRECHEYYPQLLEIPKEHLQRLLKKGELDAEELAEAEKQHDVRRREYVSQPSRPVLEVVDHSAMQRTVILGDPGSGKSSLLRFLALRWARIEDANLRYTQPLPLLIELRDYNRWDCPSGKSFPKYLHEASCWHRLNQQTLDHLLKQPDRVVLLLDGLDEVFEPAQRKDVINDIQRFSNENPNTRLVVTSRVVGYQPERLRDAEFRHFMLQDLSTGTAAGPGQIDQFLDRWHDVTFDDRSEAALKCERLRKAIEDSKPIAMLAGNPLLLTMMAILNRHQELPRDRVDLYQQATRVLLQQWDTERALGDYPELKGEVDLRAKTAILRSVAFTMQNGPHGLAGNIIDGETLTKLIEDYLHDELRFDQSRAAAAAVVRQLRERNFILCFLGADSYAFVHRTFLEYFCAADFVHRFKHEQSMKIDQLVELFDKHCRDDDWREVLRLICGQIDEQFVGQIVEHLAARTDLDEWDGKSPLPELPLAIWCLFEVRNVSKLTSTGDALLDVCAKVFERIKTSLGLARDLVAAARETRTIWASSRRPTLILNWSSGYYSNLHGYWPVFLAAIFRDRTMIDSFVSTARWPSRSGAYLALAENWPDETTRKLLAERAVQDTDFGARVGALRALAEKWPDETTQKLLGGGAVDTSLSTDRRREHIVAFGSLHSEFGRVLFTGNLDGIFFPYLNPIEPISRNHIERAAKKANIAADRIDETVRSLSEHLGWDITRGQKSSSS